MSCGFDEVACEDSDTLFEKSVTLLKDLSETCIDSVHDGDNFSPEEIERKKAVKDKERELLFIEIVSKLKCLMTDCAAVMKAFDQKMAKFGKDTLGVDCSTHFLHCNAHFLLGISDAIEASLKEIITSEFPNDKLGRDKVDKFTRFKTSKETDCETPKPDPNLFFSRMPAKK